MTVDGVSFAYDGKPTLRNVSLSFPAGRLTGLLGPNGAGKTTLFKCCLGFLAPDAGEIRLGGLPLAGYSHKHLASHVAYVPQYHHSVFPFTVREMVEMGRHPQRGMWTRSTPHDRAAVTHAIERVGIADLADRKFNQLSGGQRQLVLVARALSQEAALMFLDEPTSSLDFKNQMMVWQTVRAIAGEGVGVVVCCHDPNHIAWFCDNVVAMRDGRVVADGPAGGDITGDLLRELYDRDIRTARVDGKTFIYAETVA